MWYIIISGCLLIGVLFAARLRSCNTTDRSENNNYTINSQDNENDTIKGMFSRKQIDEKLKRLAETPPPQKLAYGAECYAPKMIMMNTIHEYICPVCGEKTIYKRDKTNVKFVYVDAMLDSEMSLCRNEIETVKGINIKLDETELCGHCSPKIDRPKLYLLVNIAGQTDTTRISSFNYMDIRLINEFLNDKLVHLDDYDFESPLKDNIGRIKELLGIK